MSGISSLIRIRDDGKIQIVRLYREGHVPLAQFEEEVADNFRDICQHFNDDHKACRIHGQAVWAYVRFGPEPKLLATIKTEPFAGSQPVTLIKVYRSSRTASAD